jgi:hypothetical protein
MPGMEDLEVRAQNLVGALSGLSSLLEGQPTGLSIPTSEVSALVSILAAEAAVILPEMVKRKKRGDNDR